MQLSPQAAGVVGVLLVAALVPGTPSPAAAPAGGQVERAPASCVAEGGTAAVRAPKLVRQIATGETGWFSSPGLVDLDGDGRLEIVAPFYSTFVFDADGRRLGQGRASAGRVYAPSVVADLEGDGITEIVVAGGEGTVAAYEFTGGGLRVKAGGRPRPAAAASPRRPAGSRPPTSTATAAPRSP